MKNLNLKRLGIVLVLSAVATAAAIQLFGTGLVWTDYPALTSAMKAQGIQSIQRTNYHVISFPLGALMIVGSIFAFLPSKSKSQH